MNANLIRRNAEIFARYQRGESGPQLSAEYWLHLTTISRIVKAIARLRGVAVREPVRFRTERNRELVRRLYAGESGSVLAVEYGISRSRVYEIAKEFRED